MTDTKQTTTPDTLFAGEAEEMLTFREVADRLKVTRKTIYAWAREGRLPVYLCGGCLRRIRLADLNGICRRKGGRADA